MKIETGIVKLDWIQKYSCGFYFINMFHIINKQIYIVILSKITKYLISQQYDMCYVKSNG